MTPLIIGWIATVGFTLVQAFILWRISVRDRKYSGSNGIKMILTDGSVRLYRALTLREGLYVLVGIFLLFVPPSVFTRSVTAVVFMVTAIIMAVTLHRMRQDRERIWKLVDEEGP